MRRKQTNFYLAVIFTALSLLAVSCSSRSGEISTASAAEKNPAVVNAEDAPVAAAQNLIEKMPDSPDGYNRLAAAYIRRARETGDFGLNAKAETALSRALEIEPENLTAQKLQASLHLTFHRFAEALAAGQKLQKDNPKDAFVYGVLTDANVELGNYKEAVEAAQRMVDLKPNMESYARVAHVRSLYGDAAGAIEAMSVAARIADPQDEEARSWCLVSLGDEYFKIGKFADAEKQYDAALEIFPDYHLALAGKAKARAARDDFDGAIKFYIEAQNRVPTADNVIALGDLYMKQGDAEKARRQYELAEVIEQKLGNTDLRRLALLWADRDQRLDEALVIAERERAARKDVYTADIYAWTLYKNGKLPEARAAINDALKLKTKDARMFYHAGMIEKDSGNKKDARRYLKLALETNPAFDLLQAENARAVLRELN